MFLRAFTVFLAALLFWSALAGQEHPLADAQHAHEASAAQPHGPGKAPGSVDHHHLDDLPQAESLTDLPWFPATRLAPALAGAAEAVPPHVDARLPAPSREAPRRPPRA